MNTDQLYKKALFFATFIVVYNVLESIVSIYMGYKDESLTLFGFGLDSLVEVASNLGVIYMIKRIRKNPDTNRSIYEKTALRITGFGFYILSVILFFGIVINLIYENKPESTFFGVIVSVLSILVMAIVVYNQLKIGKQLNSNPIIADAKCTMICIYMSVVLLLSSGLYYLTSFAYADVIGSIGLIYFSIKEGKECFEKIKNNQDCSCS